MTFPYPGDDPTSLWSVSSYIDSAHTNMQTFGTGIAGIKGQLAGAWNSDASDKAQSDMATLSTMTTTIGTDLNSASKAVEDLATTLGPIRTTIDELRTKYDAQATALEGLRETYGRADRFGEANDMTPADIATYRQSIKAAQTRVEGVMTGLENDYNAQVRKANTATALCTAALSKASTGQAYVGSNLSTVPIGQALGIGNLGILHQYKMQVLAKKYADELKGVTSVDGKGAATYHKVALEISQYAGDPDFAATFYGELGSQQLQQIPNFLYASGSSTAADDLRTYSQLFGTAVSNQSADPRMAAVANSFLNHPPYAELAWSRAALASNGTFPPDWLAKAARYNVLDDFAKNGEQGFGGMGYQGTPNGDRLPYDLGIPGDAVGAWTAALSHNPDAARDALATMGSDDPNNVTPPTGPDAWKSYGDNIHKLIAHGEVNDYPGDDARANGALFEAASGADNEIDGHHSAAASSFTQALFNDLGSGNGDNDNTQPSAADHYAKIAGSYVQELAAGAHMSGEETTPDGMTTYSGQNPAFGVPPGMTKELMHTFVGNAEATKIFDTAAGAAAHQAMLDGARVDATSPAAHESHFNDVAEAYGSVAGAENKATTDVVGEADESAAESAELTKSILSAGIDLIPGEKIAEAVPGTVWDIAKHVANMGLEHAYGETDDPRFDALKDTSHSLAVVSDYDKLSILQEAGYPGTNNIPSDLLDPSTGQLVSPDKILNNQDLQQKFHDYIYGPASQSDNVHTSVYEAMKNASGRYQDGFDTQNG